MTTLADDDTVVLDRTWTFRSRALAALDYRFEVRTDHQALGSYLEAALEPLSGDGPVEHRYSLLGRADSSVLVLVDGAVSNVCADGAHAAEWLMWHVNRSAVASMAGRVVLHAGGVRWRGRAVILPGPSGAGKSTLVAGLVEAGLGYLSDEVVALADDGTTVLAYPKPLALRAGSRAVLPRWRPQVHIQEPGLSGQSWLVDPEQVRPGCRAAPCPAGTVVAARYRRGAPTVLTPMSVTEALVELVGNSVHFGTPPEGGHIRVLGTLASGCRRLRLEFGDLAEACKLLTETLP